MINETKRRGSIYMYAGFVLALFSAFLAFQQLSAQPRPPAPEGVAPVLYVADQLANRTNLGDALDRQVEVTSVCPQLTRPNFEGEAAPLNAQSMPIGAFQVCAVPLRLITPSMVVLPELQVADATDQESLQLILSNTELVRTAIGAQLGNAYLTTELVPGDFVQANVLDSTGGLGDDMRAVSIAVNQVTSVGGTVRPGQRVDVVVSYERSNDGSTNPTDRTPFTELLLQNVEVLSISAPQLFYAQNNQFADDQFDSSFVSSEPQRFDPNGSVLSESTVTLALPLEDALRVTFMANFAREVRLITRRGDDSTIHAIAPVSQEDLGR